jgi:hypothetical protein
MQVKKFQDAMNSLANNWQVKNKIITQELCLSLQSFYYYNKYLS